MSVKQEGTSETPVEVEHVTSKAEGEFDARIEDILRSFGKAYDCATEQEPSLAAYHPSFKRAEDSCNEISSRAASLIQSSDYEDDETRQLLADIKKTGNVVYPTLSKVGLIGDSGVGECSYGLGH